MVLGLGLGACSQSNTPDEYNTLTQQNFLETCTNYYFDNTDDSLSITENTVKADVTAPTQSQCECAYDVYAGPENDGNGAMPINETVAKEEPSGRATTGPNFTDLNAGTEDRPDQGLGQARPRTSRTRSTPASAAAAPAAPLRRPRPAATPRRRPRPTPPRRPPAPDPARARAPGCPHSPGCWSLVVTSGRSRLREVRMDVCVFCGEMVDPAAAGADLVRARRPGSGSCTADGGTGPHYPGHEADLFWRGSAMLDLTGAGAVVDPHRAAGAPRAPAAAAPPRPSRPPVSSSREGRRARHRWPTPATATRSSWPACACSAIAPGSSSPGRTSIQPSAIMPFHDLAADVGADDGQRPVVERADAAGRDVGVLGREVGALLQPSRVQAWHSLSGTSW